MPNTFVTTQLVARDAAIILADNLVCLNTCNRSHEEKFGSKVGGTVTIKVPPIQVARDFIEDARNTVASDVTETSVALTITDQPYVRHDLTSDEKSLSLDDFAVQVVRPAVLAIRDRLDRNGIRTASRGFGRYLAGTDGNSPSTVAHLLAARKILVDNGTPLDGEVHGMLDTTAEAALLQLAQFTSKDYGEDGATALKEAIIARRYGVNWMVDQNCGTFDRGSVAGTVHVNDGGGALDVGDTEVNINDFDVATGTIYAGTRLTFAGDTTVYTVTANATKSGSAATIAITPALVAAPANDAVVTFKAAFKENFIYHRNAMACAIVPPAPLAVNSSVQFFNGVGIRVSMSSSTVSLSDSIVFDTYFAGAVIQPKAGVIVQG